MRCKCGHENMMGGRTQTVLSDDGSLAITAMWCPRCERIIEEVRLLSRRTQATPPHGRYTVRPFVAHADTLRPTG